jgi:DNA-binding NtrC family response regulator
MKRKRVLVAASERHIARLVQVNLERQGYEVELAFDSDSCWEKVMALRPDLIVLDMDMPNAKQLGAKLKTTEETKSIPVITLERGFSLQDFWFGNLKSPTLSLFAVLLLMVLLALAFVVLIMFART